MSVKADGDSLPDFRFRLGSRSHSLLSCVCLYRSVDPETLATTYVLMTKDRRFAFLETRVGDGVRIASGMTREAAMRFLLQHGEGDVVEEFPDLFREEEHVRPPAEQAVEIAAAPKDRPAEPYLFPLH